MADRLDPAEALAMVQRFRTASLLDLYDLLQVVRDVLRERANEGAFKFGSRSHQLLDAVDDCERARSRVWDAFHEGGGSDGRA